MVKDKGFAELKTKTDSLEKLIRKIKPGLGEMMNTIQLHHEKLWFAANMQNWALAKYECDEMKETFEQTSEIETERPEIKKLSMIFPQINLVSQAIINENLNDFKLAYNNLTTTCNTCHTATDHGFNVIGIPTSPQVTDQRFSLQK